MARLHARARTYVTVTTKMDNGSWLTYVRWKRLELFKGPGGVYAFRAGALRAFCVVDRAESPPQERGAAAKTPTLGVFSCRPRGAASVELPAKFSGFVA